MSGYRVLFKLRETDEFFFGSIFPIVPLPLASEDEVVPAHLVPAPPLMPEGSRTSAGNPQGRLQMGQVPSMLAGDHSFDMF